MLNTQQLAAALDSAEGPADVSKVEFEVLDSGATRWILWDGERRLFSATLERGEMSEALSASAVLLRTSALVREGAVHGQTN